MAAWKSANCSRMQQVLSQITIRRQMNSAHTHKILLNLQDVCLHITKNCGPRMSICYSQGNLSTWGLWDPLWWSKGNQHFEIDAWVAYSNIQGQVLLYGTGSNLNWPKLSFCSTSPPTLIQFFQ